jgi:hypothetical protein
LAGSRTVSGHVTPEEERDHTPGRDTQFELYRAALCCKAGFDLEPAEPDTKLYCMGKYPPLRGRLMTLDDREMILYTKGSVDFFETYPGLYIPSLLSKITSVESVRR